MTSIPSLSKGAIAEADAPVSVINSVYSLCWTEQILADRTEFAVISYHDFHFGVVHKFAQDLGFGKIRAGQTLFRIDAVDADEHDIGEEHLGRGVASGPTRVNQVPRRCPPVTITSMSFLLLNSIATFTVLVMMEMPLSPLRLRTTSVVVVPPLNAIV